MKTFLTFASLLFMAYSCSPKQTDKEEPLSPNKPEKVTEKIFTHISEFPVIKDTSEFIADLRETFDLDVHDSPKSKEIEKISFYRKVNIYGSDEDFYLVEYDYGVGSMASFPWKYQLLLTTKGKLVKTLSGLRFGFIEIFPKQNPFLINVISTARGNGGHEFYKISKDTLENVYEGYYDYAIQTYDAGQNNSVFEPEELNVVIDDYNKDGFNDISFKGKIVLIQGRTKSGFWYDSETRNGKTISYSINNPFKTAPIEFVFLYEKVSGHFKAKEDYEKKYKEFRY